MEVFDALPASLQQEIRRSHAHAHAHTHAAAPTQAPAHQAASNTNRGSSTLPASRKKRRGGTRKLEAFFVPAQPPYSQSQQSSRR